MKKIVSVVGARPNFIKLASVNDILSKKFEHIVIHTGQHYDYELSKVFFEHLNIQEPDYYLGVGSGSYGYQIGEMIKRLEKVLIKEKPDIVLVYGDTNSALGGALAAVEARLKVAHVEAGLRSYDPNMIEEINRKITDHVSYLLFAPTRNAIENLKKENVYGKIFLTGDVHVDVLKRWLSTIERKSDILARLGLENKNYLVATVHRAENTDDPARLLNIVKALTKIECMIVLPLHPRTRSALKKFGFYKLLSSSKNIKIIKPLGYIDFIKLVKHSYKVITDSGGVQREAYLLRVPSIVLRDRTEWIELVEYGWVKLVDANPEKVVDAVKNFEPDHYVTGLLGNGKAGEKIIDIIKDLDNDV